MRLKISFVLVLGAGWLASFPARAEDTPRVPKYMGAGDYICVAWGWASVRPAVKKGPWKPGNPAEANDRIPFMDDSIFAYAKALYANSQCKNLSLQSTYRDCHTNLTVRGVTKSRHLCGAAADTAGCPDAGSKTVAKQVCESQKLQFIDEGPNRYAHCQTKNLCPSVLNNQHRLDK